MRKACGTISVFLLGTLFFRLAYGGWLPHDGTIAKWLSTDPLAMKSLAVGLIVVVVGTVIGQTVEKAFERER